MTISPQQRTEAGQQPPSCAASDEYQFRAPRYGDLVACPYCDAGTFTCDHCGGESRLYANEVFQ